MNAYVNYLIEANIGLLIFLVCYKGLLRSETNFRMLRIFLLTGIFASLAFPLIHVQNDHSTSLLSIGQVLPSYWLPEVVIGGTAADAMDETSFNFRTYGAWIYFGGVMCFCAIIIFQLAQILRIIRKTTTYRIGRFQIAESPENKSTFSFFHFIFIGQADQFSETEKKQIIQHEIVHASQWHSFDIMLIQVLKIFFWFNPFMSVYKKTFIQLHEFEADARAVEHGDVNKYCSLLARVALQSADFTLANHFNNSLTVKRIEMMRTLKTKIKEWKLVALVIVVPFVFFFIACQDQVGDELTEITRNSTHALIVPEHIQSRFEQVKKENPDKNYVLLELNETATNKLQGLEAQYGLPKHIEVIEVAEGKTILPSVNGKSMGEIIAERGAASSEVKQTFAIIEFNEETSKLAEASQEDRIFTVVEETPEFPGGYDSMMVFIRQNLRYPAEARMKGIEGTVYVSFIVGKDGTVSEAKIIRGISPEADREALRVIQLSPPWIPGKQNKEVVNVRFVLPIKFKLGQ